MGMAQHKAGPGMFTASRRCSRLEPATITDRRYPLLFQQGETAFGVPIADGQHPHDFIMELAALYDLKLGDEELLTLYFAPVGDPAIGPTAYPHRASASEDPVGALGHHQEDSTHIAADVLPLGLLMASRGSKPRDFMDANRTNFAGISIRARSIRGRCVLRFSRGKTGAAQYSYARITSPEGLFPAENQERMTASIMYNRPLSDGNWSNTSSGATHSLQDHSIFNSYLLESLVRFRTRNEPGRASRMPPLQ